MVSDDSPSGWTTMLLLSVIHSLVHLVPKNVISQLIVKINRIDNQSALIFMCCVHVKCTRLDMKK